MSFVSSDRLFFLFETAYIGSLFPTRASQLFVNINTTIHIYYLVGNWTPLFICMIGMALFFIMQDIGLKKVELKTRREKREKLITNKRDLFMSTLFLPFPCMRNVFFGVSRNDHKRWPLTLKCSRGYYIKKIENSIPLWTPWDLL